MYFITLDLTSDLTRCMIYLHFLCAADLARKKRYSFTKKTNRLNSIIGSSVLQDDKISLRLPSTGRQQMYRPPPCGQRRPESTAARMGSDASDGR